MSAKSRHQLTSIVANIYEASYQDIVKIIDCFNIKISQSIFSTVKPTGKMILECESIGEFLGDFDVESKDYIPLLRLYSIVKAMTEPMVPDELAASEWLGSRNAALSTNCDRHGVSTFMLRHIDPGMLQVQSNISYLLAFLILKSHHKTTSTSC